MKLAPFFLALVSLILVSACGRDRNDNLQVQPAAAPVVTQPRIQRREIHYYHYTYPYAAPAAYVDRYGRVCRYEYRFTTAAGTRVYADICR